MTVHQHAFDHSNPELYSTAAVAGQHRICLPAEKTDLIATATHRM